LRIHDRSLVSRIAPAELRWLSSDILRKLAFYAKEKAQRKSARKTRALNLCQNQQVSVRLLQA
jgi:hypothetical protein